jgi:hypothetical protein
MRTTIRGEHLLSSKAGPLPRIGGYKPDGGPFAAIDARGRHAIEV